MAGASTAPRHCKVGSPSSLITTSKTTSAAAAKALTGLMSLDRLCITPAIRSIISTSARLRFRARFRAAAPSGTNAARAADCVPGTRHFGDEGREFSAWAIVQTMGLGALQEHSNHREAEPAASCRFLQCAESPELCQSVPAGVYCRRRSRRISRRERTRIVERRWRLSRSPRRATSASATHSWAAAARAEFSWRRSSRSSSRDSQAPPVPEEPFVFARKLNPKTDARPGGRAFVWLLTAGYRFTSSFSTTPSLI